MMDSRQATKPNEDELLVVLKDKIAYAAIRGRGSFQIAPAIKKFCLSVIGQECNHLVIDMSECIGMDSTFMGVVAGLSTSLKRLGGKIDMVHLTPQTRSALATLGLDQVVVPYVGEQTPPEIEKELQGLKEASKPEDTTASRLLTAETIMIAHESLVEVLPENLPRFKDVLTYFKEDVEKLRNEES